MRERLKFLSIASLTVKIVAWIFLALGALAGISIVLGFAPGNPRWMGIVVIAIYGFSFFFFYLVAKLADFISEIIKELKKE